MRRSVRAIVFNTDEAYAPTIRALLLKIEGVQIVAEVDDLGMLAPAVTRFPAELLIINLDPSPEATIGFVQGLVAEHPDLAVLAISECADGKVILSAMRAGIREYLTKPVDPDQLESAITRTSQHAAAKAEPGRILCVMSSVGGAGATTVAVNLAVELAALCGEPGKVAVVDLDFHFGQVATMLDVQPPYSIADLCDTPERLDPQLISRAMASHASGVHVLARPAHFAQAQLITAAHCAGVLTSLQELYRYVVVDGPTRSDAGGRAVLDLAAVQLMVMQLLVPSVRNVHRIIEELAANGYNLDRLKLVCNRHNRESGYLEREHVETTLNRTFFAMIPDDWKTVSAAVNMGVPLIESAPKSKVRQALADLARAIAGDEAPAEQAPKKNAGLFGKIFSSA